jgi:hypothetical protein
MTGTRFFIRLDQFSLEPLELGVGGFLSALHERGVTNHVGGQDRRQSSLKPVLRHSALRTTKQTRRWNKEKPSTLLWTCGR